MQVHYPNLVWYCHTTTFLIIDYQAYGAVKSILQFEFSHFAHSGSNQKLKCSSELNHFF